MIFGVAQIDCVENNTNQNLSTINSFIKKAKMKGCNLVLFPELSTSGYFLDSIKNNSLKADSPAFERLSLFAQKSDITVVVGLPFNTDDGIFNCQFCFYPSGQKEELYRKTHLFPGEAKQFEFGDTLKLHNVEGTPVAPLICYDLRFSDLFVKARKLGTKLFFLSAAWPMSRVEHWKALIKARAIETQSFIIASNRCGTDKGLELAGNSMIVNPLGEVIAQSSCTEDLITAQLDISSVDSIREQFAFFEDRREELYR